MSPSSLSSPIKSLKHPVSGTMLEKEVPLRLFRDEVFAAETASFPHKATFLQFPKLSGESGLVHAVFTRHGGASGPPFDSLNASYSTGDNPDRVMRNLEIIRHAMDAPHLLFMNQMHGKTSVIVSGGSLPPHASMGDADAMITDRPGAALMVKQADCQGVILYEPSRRVLAVIHCGWRGNTLNILGSVVECMNSTFRCAPSRIMAAIGPSLGPCCAEFTGYKDIFPPSFASFLVGKNTFDLWALSKRQLVEAGVEEVHVETAGICTRCRKDLFFSYRAEKKTGRFATVAMLT